MPRLAVPLLAGLLLAVALLAPTAEADWLVLRDGSRVETAGSWETKGRQVIFKQKDGVLSALRLADVDLEASATATAESRMPATAAAASEPQPERRAPVLVLTDKDIPPAAPEPEEGEVTESAVPEPGSEEAGAVEPVVLVSWESQESSDIDGLEIVGSVHNTGVDVAAAIRVGVQLRDQDEELLIDTQAFLQSTSLVPRQRSTFKVLLPGIYTLLTDPTFEVTSEAITIGGAPKNEDVAAGSEAEGEEPEG